MRTIWIRTSEDVAKENTEIVSAESRCWGGAIPENGAHPRFDCRL